MTNPGPPQFEVAVPRHYERPQVESVLTEEQLARQVHYAGGTL